MSLKDLFEFDLLKLAPFILIGAVLWFGYLSFTSTKKP